MSSPVSPPCRRLLVGLLLLAVGLFFWRPGARDLWSSHEARAAMNASSLLAADGQGLPRLYDGRLELQKPPLYYWLVAAIGWCGGEVDALAVRLPAALSAAGVVALVTLTLALGCGRPVAGVVAGLSLAVGIHFPWLARIGRIDMPLTLAVTVAGLAFTLGPRSSHPRLALLAGYLACAAGLLLKGPIGVVLPAAIVVAARFAEGTWPAVWELTAWRRLLTELGVIRGVLVVLVLTVPVFAWMQHASDGAFGREFIWHHNVQRGLGGSRLRGHPWWMYGVYFMLYFLPASPFVLAAMLHRRAWRDDVPARLGLAWLLGVTVVLSAARFKRADYLLPAYPGAALFLGCVGEQWLAGLHGRRVLAGVVGMVATMLVGWGLYLGWRLPQEEPYRDYRRFAAAIRARAPAPREIVFFRTERHALDFRVGRPLTRLVEYDRLRQRLARPGVHYLVMPPEVAAEARQVLGVGFEECSRNTDLSGGEHERPLLLLRVHTPDPGAHARLPATAADRRSAAEPAAAAP